MEIYLPIMEDQEFPSLTYALEETASDKSTVDIKWRAEEFQVK